MGVSTSFRDILVRKIAYVESDTTNLVENMRDPSKNEWIPQTESGDDVTKFIFL